MNLFLSLLFLASANLWAQSFVGHDGGNGGDPVRMRFIDLGANILLKQESDLRSVLGASAVTEMRAKLSIDYLRLSGTLLYDNQGSVVSALGDASGIELYVGPEYPDLSWTTLLEQPASARRLVLHEMLRLVNRNDDNFILSNQILRPVAAVDLSQIIDLPAAILPLSVQDMMSKGRRYKVEAQTSCGEAEGFQLSFNAAMVCDTKTSSCRVSEVWSKTQLFDLKLRATAEDERLMSKINELGTKGFITCDYQRELRQDCGLGSLQKLVTSMNCSMLLSEKLTAEGEIHIQTLQHQQQQEQQQRQQQQQQQQQSQGGLGSPSETQQ